MGNYAYVSLIGTNNYIYPAICLMTSWKRTDPKYPFYIMVTKDITAENRKILSTLGYRLIDIDEYVPTNYQNTLNNSPINDKELSLHGGAHQDNGWRHAYSKLMIWNLTQFDKLCWLDLDIMVWHNIDDVFDYPATCWLEGDRNKYIYSQLMLVEPNKEIFNLLIDYCNNYTRTDEGYTLYTDEMVLASFFEHSRKNAVKTIPLTYCYQLNQTDTVVSPIIRDFPHIRAVHLSVQQKPWIYGKKWVENFNIEWYISRFMWIYYIDILNEGIEELNEKGFNIQKVD